MTQSAVSARKKAQKESFLFQEISKLFHEIVLDDKRLQDFTVSRVALSRDKGVINIFFYTVGGEKVFKEKFNFLVLYKPSLRKAIAHIQSSRYTPELVFKFDDLFEKQQKIEDIFQKLHENE